MILLGILIITVMLTLAIEEKTTLKEGVIVVILFAMIYFLLSLLYEQHIEQNVNYYRQYQEGIVLDRQPISPLNIQQLDLSDEDVKAAKLIMNYGGYPMYETVKFTEVKHHAEFLFYPIIRPIPADTINRLVR